MKNLHFYEAVDVDRLVWPTDYHFISMQTSAMAVFNDFKQSKPTLIAPDVTAIEAERLMRLEHVMIKMVVDEEGRFLGVVCLDDLDSQELLKMVANGYVRAELRVRDFMRPKASLRSFDYAELEQATIRDVIDALQHSGQQYCLVVERDNQAVRGIISAKDLAEKIRLPLDVQNRSSFVHVFNAIYH